MLNTMNGYFEETNGNKYLTLVPTNESKELSKYEELWIKIRYLIRLVTNQMIMMNSLFFLIGIFLKHL